MQDAPAIRKRLRRHALSARDLTQTLHEFLSLLKEPLTELPVKLITSLTGTVPHARQAILRIKSTVEFVELLSLEFLPNKRISMEYRTTVALLPK